MYFYTLITFALATTVAVSAAIEDTNTVHDGVTRAKHHGGPHNGYEVDEPNKILTIPPYPRFKWILPVGAYYKRDVVDANDKMNDVAKWILPMSAHYKRQAVDANGEEKVAAKWIKVLPPGAHM
ncbi:hypothetical protein BGZ93_007707 [Podila epicladia]|nr:hypothetical protein BGZ92_005316 [Podila epicladia]KAG0099435.1 hypothetical protein BGZ93_007707 [Podila epicladia]